MEVKQRPLTIVREVYKHNKIRTGE
jgi:hypothetical protein